VVGWRKTTSRDSSHGACQPALSIWRASDRNGWTKTALRRVGEDGRGLVGLDIESVQRQGGEGLGREGKVGVERQGRIVEDPVVGIDIGHAALAPQHGADVAGDVLLLLEAQRLAAHDQQAPAK